MTQPAHHTSSAPAARPEIEGQINGYWIEPGDDVPSVRPAHDPTGAILVARRGDEGTYAALSLVRRNDGSYAPVSHAAVLTYFHTTGMLDGETRKFAVFDPDRLTALYECLPPLEEASSDDIRALFGDAAAARCRDHYPTVVFRVRRIDVHSA